MMMTCYNVSGEPDDEDNPRAVDILDSKESRDIRSPEGPGDKFKKPLKLKKVNIGTIEDPKLASFGNH